MSSADLVDMLKDPFNHCRVCHVKNTPETPLKTCARCRIYKYCSKAHQAQDWKWHKFMCNNMEKIRKDRLDPVASRIISLKHPEERLAHLEDGFKYSELRRIKIPFHLDAKYVGVQGDIVSYVRRLLKLDDAVLTPKEERHVGQLCDCLLYTSPSPRDRQKSRMPSSA